MHPLRVVVLVPEQRQHDHRLAEVQALGGGVVPAVRDHQVGERDDRGLRHELRAPHVRRQGDLLVQRPQGHHVPVRGGRQAVDHPLHQADVGRPQRTQREVDQGAVAAGQRGRQGEFPVGRAHGGVQPVPARPWAGGPRVVGQLRIDVEVGRALVDELQARQRRRAAGGDPGVEVFPQRQMHPLVLGAEVLPAGLVGGGVAGEGRRNVRRLDLQRVAGHDADERHAPGQQRREADHVVLDDHVGADPPHDLLQLRLAVPGAVGQLGEHRLDPAVQLLDGRLAELRCGPCDVVLPELAGLGPGLGRRGQVDQIFLEAERREPPLPRPLGGEHDPVPAAAQHIADADAVVGRPVGALRHHHDRQRRYGHRWHLPSPVRPSSCRPQCWRWRTGCRRRRSRCRTRTPGAGCRCGWPRRPRPGTAPQRR